MNPRQTLEDWLAHIESLHPLGAAGIEMGLGRVEQVFAALGLEKTPACLTVTVGGTNGKGSCVAMLEAIALAAGLRVAVFTSPHLLRYNERVRVQGEDADDAAWVRAFTRVEQARGTVPLTYFEYGTLAALVLMLESAPELMVLEVGMGGRLDAVNVVDAHAFLLTNVALDHMAMLGADREAIGREKAGIMRAGQTVVLAEAMPPHSVLDHAAHCGLRPGIELWQRGIEFDITDAASGCWQWSAGNVHITLPLPALPGAHQIDNAAGVIALLHALDRRGMLPKPVNAAHYREGLQQVRHPGRLQKIPAKVDVWLDVAHNPAGMQALAQSMRSLPKQGRTLLVFAVLADKDALGMAEILAPEVDAWYLAGLQGARGRQADALAALLLLTHTGLPIVACEANPVLAYTRALQDAREGDRIFVAGSFLCVSDVLAHQASSGAGHG